MWGWVGPALPKTANACRYSVLSSILIFPGVKEPLAVGLFAFWVAENFHCHRRLPGLK